MFRWLSRWKMKRSRGIFRYFDGQQYRFGDPLAILDAIDLAPEFDSRHDPLLASRGDRTAMLKLVAVVCRAFDVKPFESGGLTIQERIDLFVEFGSFVATLKKNIVGPRSSQRASELAKVFPKLNGKTMADSVASISTSPSSNGVEPTPCD